MPADSIQRKPEVGPRRNLIWLYCFYAFAVINIAALATATWLAADICRSYAASTVTAEHWVEQRAQLDRLRQHMREMHLTVGESVFQEDSTASRDRFGAVYARLTAQFARAGVDIERFADQNTAAQFQVILGEVAEQCERAAALASEVFNAVDRGDTKATANGVVTAYRAIAAGHYNLDRLFAAIREIHENFIASERRIGKRNSQRVTGIGVMLLILIALGGIYGLRLSRRFLRDDFQRNESLRAAMAATEAKSVFLTNTSHEIRTPLTAILGFAEHLSTSDVSAVQRREMVNIILRSGKHLLAIVNDILDVAKIDAGGMVVERAGVSVPGVIADVVSMVRARAAERGLDFVVRFEGLIPSTALTDAKRLRQILVNLLGNAVKFTARGEVQLIVGFCATRGNEGYLQFDVIDSGLGITGSQAAELFQPFVQVDPSTTRRFGGTGLGLAISRRLARLLGGDVVLVRSDTRGSHFRATVESGPIEPGTMVSNPQLDHLVEDDVGNSEEGAQGQQLAGRRVLLVEDGEDNQRLITLLLRRAGAEVTVAADGQLAVDMAQSADGQGRGFDLILMDMQMPRMDGYEATRALRREGYGGTIIALTAHALSGDRERCLMAGCDDYATKPIQRSVLIRTIREHLESTAVGASRLGGLNRAFGNS